MTLGSPAAIARNPAEEEHLHSVASFFDNFARDEGRWRRTNRTYYRLVESIHRFLIPEGAAVLEIGSGSGDLLAALCPARGLGVDVSDEMTKLARTRHPELEFVTAAGEQFVADEQFDYVILSDLVPFAFDLEALFRNIRSMAHDRTRVVVHSYSQLWRPLIRLAEMLRLKPRKPISNWVTPGDVRNLFALADFEAGLGVPPDSLAEEDPAADDAVERGHRPYLGHPSALPDVVGRRQARARAGGTRPERLGRRPVSQ